MGVIQSCSLRWLDGASALTAGVEPRPKHILGIYFINLLPFVSVPSSMAQGEERIRTVIFICRMDRNVSAAHQKEIVYSKENLKAIEENWAVALHWSSPGTLPPGTSVLQAFCIPKSSLAAREDYTFWQ